MTDTATQHISQNSRVTDGLSQYMNASYMGKVLCHHSYISFAMILLPHPLLQAEPFDRNDG
jgi:hypothetical protein